MTLRGASRLCRLDVKAPLHLIDKTIVFVDLTLYPIKLLLLQVIHCEDDRDKIDRRSPIGILPSSLELTPPKD